MNIQNFKDNYLSYMTESFWGGLYQPPFNISKRKLKLAAEKFEMNARKTFDNFVRYYSFDIRAKDQVNSEEVIAIRRRYHTIDHVLDMISALDENRGFWGISQEEYVELFMAITWHDCIYHTYLSDSENVCDKNENRSAASFEYVLGEMWRNIDSRRITKIQDLIRATDPMLPMSTNLLEGVIRDLDLMGLGSDPQQFDFNSQLIRMEYSNYSDQEYYTGRIKFFEMLLERDSIFHTQLFYGKYEDQARENIERELVSIRKLVKEPKKAEK